MEHQFLPRNRENKSELQIYEGLGNKVSYYYVQRQSYGWLELSNFDTISQKISGRFELDLVNEKNYSDTIKVREGIFDGWFSMVR